MRATARLAPLAAFLLLIVPLVAFCAWRVPTGQVPDEPTHVMRAASLLQGAVMGHRGGPNGETGARDAGVTGNTGLALAALAGNGEDAPLAADASRAARLAWVRAIPWQPERRFVSAPNTAAYAPLGYLPAALGLGAAMLMGLRPHAAIIGARLANTLAFALIGGLALLLARRGGLLLLIVLGLPMTIWLAGSVSQDGLVIATAALGAAVLTRPGPAAFWCGCGVLAVLVLQKPPFIPLAMLPLIVPPPVPPVVPGRFDAPSLARRLAGALGVALPGLLWSVAVAAWVSVPLLPGPPYRAGPLWPGDPSRSFRSAIAAAQIAVILHHPLRVALMPVTQGNAATRYLWLQLIGFLGQLSIRLPSPLYTLWTAAIVSGLGALATARPPGEPRLRWFTPPLAVAAMALTVELIFVALYLTWTPVGMAHVDGIQGRYFIPLLPVLLFVVPGRASPVRVPPWLWWPLPLAAMLATDVTLPRLIAAQFYR